MLTGRTLTEHRVLPLTIVSQGGVMHILTDEGRKIASGRMNTLF